MIKDNIEYTNRLSSFYGLFAKTLYNSGQINEWQMPYFNVYELEEGNPIASMGRRDQSQIIRLILDSDFNDLSFYESNFFDEVPMLTICIPEATFKLADIEIIISKYVIRKSR